MKHLFFSLCAGAVGCALALQFPAAAIAKGKETVLHSFGSGTDGVAPEAGLIDVKGTLYGTTMWGGAHCGIYSCGTVFALDAKTDAETVLYSFCSEYDCTDGQGPSASLIDVKGKLYGTTSAGGIVNCDYFGGPYLGCGTVFALDPKTGAETVLHSFSGGRTDGSFPDGALIDMDGTFYGTTSAGGANCERHEFGGCGSVFSIDPTTGAEAVLYSFCAQKNCPDGYGPEASLIDVNGTMYGTTEGGGAYGSGTVFAFDVKTGTETALHSFGSSTDGALPVAGLIDVKGTLYGTTEMGGTNGNGTVFSLDLRTGAETVLYAFCSHPIHDQCRDGEWPNDGLIDVKGTLYGTTSHGGTYQNDLPGNGVLFALDPKTGAETVLDAFRNSKNGAYSEANLIDVMGTLYGTTAGGGDNDDGVMFALRP